MASLISETSWGQWLQWLVSAWNFHPTGCPCRSCLRSGRLPWRTSVTLWGIGQDMLGTIFLGGGWFHQHGWWSIQPQKNGIKRDENQLHWDYKAQYIGMLKSEDGQTLVWRREFGPMPKVQFKKNSAGSKMGVKFVAGKSGKSWCRGARAREFDCRQVLLRYLVPFTKEWTQTLFIHVYSATLQSRCHMLLILHKLTYVFLNTELQWITFHIMSPERLDHKKEITERCHIISLNTWWTQSKVH